MWEFWELTSAYRSRIRIADSKSEGLRTGDKVKRSYRIDTFQVCTGGERSPIAGDDAYAECRFFI